MTMHRIILVLLLFAVMPAAARPASAAPASSVEVASITIVPESPAAGQQPEITARIARKAAAAPQEPGEFAIVAVVTMPDNRTKSWMWKSIALRPGEAREFALPKMFDTKLNGRYKIEYNVYSADMRRRFASSMAVFSAGPAAKPAVPPAAAAGKEEARRPQAEPHAFGLGISANALNPAGGGTMMLWQFRNVGLQGTYTVGTFSPTGPAAGEVRTVFGIQSLHRSRFPERVSGQGCHRRFHDVQGQQRVRGGGCRGAARPQGPRLR